jgi:hypothetical protein
MSASLRSAFVVAVVATLAACEDTTPVWELDNDRIIAVRATPPHVPAGARASLDALVTRAGIGPTEAVPMLAAAVPMRPDLPVPAALAAAVVTEAGAWSVVAPDEPTLAALRTELGLMPGAPVPVLVGLTFEFAAGPLAATKTVILGDLVDNPTLGEVTVAGVAAADGMMIPADTNVVLHATAADTDEVDWLTSVGDLGDADDADATLLHDTAADPPRPTSGHLAVVKRDATIGVTWGYWTISVLP